MIFALIATILFSLFSTCVLSYIAMATPIGPWIAPTLVIIGSTICRLICMQYQVHNLAYAVAGGSVGGIVATACAFSFPTLFFLDASLFNSWIAQPAYFVGIMCLLCMSAGLFGYMCAGLFERSFIYEQKMSFPIGTLVYRMLTARDQVTNQRRLWAGFSVASVVSLLQGGIWQLPTILARSVTLVPTFSIGCWTFARVSLRLTMLPMLLAIGFIAGKLIALPLMIGALSKLLIFDPLAKWCFSQITYDDCMLAFATGIVLIGALQSFLVLPGMVRQYWQQYKYNNNNQTTNKLPYTSIKQWLAILNVFEIVAVLFSTILFLSLLGFGLAEQLFLVCACLLSTYQITLIAGKIGLAQLGRFATFVMVPMLMIFGVDPVRATITAAFVEISGGVATDILFGRKMGYLLKLSPYTLKRYQLFGLVLASCFIGVIFWLLITHFSLGSEQLFAQRAQARALLVHVQYVNLYLLVLGMLYGWTLKRLRVNPLLVLGGLLMPINYSLGLILGGIFAMCTSHARDWEPFWSGMFAANSIWEVFKIIL